MRKAWLNDAGSIAKERIYLGPFELWREWTVSSGVFTTKKEERETLHVSDDSGRICMLETLTVTGSSPVGTPSTKQRFQYSNHLGTAALEVDADTKVISYEECHPFGSTAYHAFDSSLGVGAKRYRYTGKERDDETGLYYHGARYYACWLGRWTAGDPIGLGDGVNRYAYVSGNPVRRRDGNGNAADDVTVLAEQIEAVAAALANTPEDSQEYETLVEESGMLAKELGQALTRAANTASYRHNQEQTGQRIQKAMKQQEAFDNQQAISNLGAGTSKELDDQAWKQQTNRGIEASKTPLAAASLYGNRQRGMSKDESLERAEMVANAENAVASLANPVKNVTRSSIPVELNLQSGRDVGKPPAVVWPSHAAPPARTALQPKSRKAPTRPGKHESLGKGSGKDFVETNPTTGKGIFADMDAHGVVSTVIEAGKGSPIRGTTMFARAMRHFGIRTNAVRGFWVAGTNLKTVNDLTASGTTLEKAVTMTFTGKRAADWGFDHVSSIEAEGKAGAYTKIEVIFTRP